MESSLAGQCVAIPESRQLDILANLVQARGASVVRLPLVAILDAPDQQPIATWLKCFIAQPPEMLIILTGEGLRRLLSASERLGCRQDFIATLGQVKKICRGPKPGRALKEIGLNPDLLGQEPTSAGIIRTLESMELHGRNIGVQLYGEEPNVLLTEYLKSRGAKPHCVSPYIYAPQTDEEAVAAFIASLSTRAVTAIMFTSQPQYRRLLEVAAKRDLVHQLRAGLAALQVVAVGPVVAAQLQDDGVKVHVMPEDSFFMKPMVTALVRALQSQSGGTPLSDGKNE
jgi:uroporphyrinogen-III synthase